ncbi:DUF805 domain-containing protein [Nibrella viscosa]|uniref:DUF805 domain-containing protein n=1 Tax=Nibrella viscosa TaxID=1084524 RepID=A0ABP8KX36_9BACT
MNAYINALRNFADFRGRTRRSEYWFFVLFNILFIVLLIGIDVIIIGSGNGFGVLTSIYVLATLIPSTAVAVRRLHDSGRSGWWLLLTLIPLGGLVLLIFYVQDSVPGVNKWGPNPKETQSAEVLNNF